jgi:hypothetical protein
MWPQMDLCLEAWVNPCFAAGIFFERALGTVSTMIPDWVEPPVIAAQYRT